MKFVCPKCRGLLSVSDGVAACENKHTYDRSRYGYFNLLLGRGGGTHGDNAEMVEARRSFLNTGAYYPLAEQLAKLIDKYVKRGSLLDVGCGEGYYTDIIEQRLGDRVKISAFDISRAAVKYASRRNSGIELAVASAYDMPVADSSFDSVVNVFSPLALDEVRRVLTPGGVFVMVIPGEEHLFGLKRATYKTPYKNTVESTRLSGFELIDTSCVKYSLALDTRDKINSLFMMTPYAYRTGREERERVLSLDRLETEIEFIILVYRKI